MEGRQKEIYNEIMNIANKIFDGCYGVDDNLDEDSIGEDLGLVIVEFEERDF